MSTGLGVAVFFFIISMSTYLFVGHQELDKLDETQNELIAIEKKSIQKNEEIAKLEMEINRLKSEKESFRVEIEGLERELEETSRKVVSDDDEFDLQISGLKEHEAELLSELEAARKMKAEMEDKLKQKEP